MKVALVHDYLAQDGGAERVLKAFHEIWPEAPIFVLYQDAKKITNFNQEKIKESFLGKFPFITSRYQWYLPLMSTAIERHNLENFDLVLSSTSSFAKGVLTHPGTLHISYCHTPTRFLWSATHSYLSDFHYSWFVKASLPGLITRLRLWDKMSADRVDHFIANSRTVQTRISKYYRRPSEVIHPPVDTSKFKISNKIDDYFLTGGRLVPYKRMDLVVKVFNRLRWPLKIFGTGPELERLKSMARDNIEFLGRISEAEKVELFSEAKAFIHPQNEDFGITPLESMASGRPVIAFNQGGATETVLSGETGIFFQEQSWEELLNTLLRFNEHDWNSQRIREHAAGFGIDNFKTKIKNHIDHRYEEFKRGVSQPLLFQNELRQGVLLGDKYSQS